MRILKAAISEIILGSFLMGLTNDVVHPVHFYDYPIIGFVSWITSSAILESARTRWNRINGQEENDECRSDV